MDIVGLTLFNGFNGGTHFYTFEIAEAGQYSMYAVVYAPFMLQKIQLVM